MRKNKLSGILLLESIPKKIEDMKVDVLKCFNKGNKSAGIRVRKGLKRIQEILKAVKKESLRNKIK